MLLVMEETLMHNNAASVKSVQATYQGTTLCALVRLASAVQLVVVSACGIASGGECMQYS